MTREELRGWLFNRLQGVDARFGFGPRGEDRTVPWLAARAIIRSGSPRLRETLERIVVEALATVSRGDGDVPDVVVDGLLRLAQEGPVSDAHSAIRRIVDEHDAVLGRRSAETVLLQGALGALSAMGCDGEDYWKSLVERHPEPATLLAAVRAMARRSVESAIDLLSWAGTKGRDPEADARAVGPLLPTLWEWWLREGKERTLPEFRNLVKRKSPAMETQLERYFPTVATSWFYRNAEMNLGISVQAST